MNNLHGDWMPTGETWSIRSRFRAVRARLGVPLLAVALFWPVLTLIARQTVYFSGPARSSFAILYGSQRGSHIFLYLNYAILGIFVVTGWPGIWTRLKQNLVLSATLILALSSVLWTSSQKISVQMFIEVSLCTLFALYLSSRLNAEQLMRVLMAIGAVASLLSVVFAIALPSYGIFAGYGTTAWEGICNHKNTLGVSSAYLLLPAFFARSLPRSLRIVYSVLLLLLIAMSQSRGAWFYAAGVMAFIVWLHLYRRLALSESRMLILFTGLCMALVVVCVAAYFAEIAEIIGKDATMSGRFRIYEEVLNAIQKKPFLGYGLGGFWFPGSLESQRLALSIGWANIGYSENGILELALQVGIVGVAMVLGMIGRAAWQGFRLLRTPFYSDRIGWYLSILVLAMLTNVDAGWFLTSDTLDWVLIVIACVGLNEEWHAASWHAEAARSQSAGWQIARVGAAEAASGGARA